MVYFCEWKLKEKSARKETPKTKKKREEKNMADLRRRKPEEYGGGDSADDTHELAGEQVKKPELSTAESSDHVSCLFTIFW